MKKQKKQVSVKPHKILNRKKTDPYKFIYTGAPIDNNTIIQLFTYNSSGCTEKEHVLSSEIPAFPLDDNIYWMNLCGLEEVDVIERTCRLQGIHNLVIQDILDINQRPKFQDFESYSFLTIKSTIPANNEYNTEQISFILGKNYLISFQEKQSDYFEHIRYRLREKKGVIREKSSDYLLYVLLESILDNYFRTLQQLENEIEAIDLLRNNFDASPAILQLIEQKKKFVHLVRKAIIPVKEFTQIVERDECKLIDSNNLKYFYEIKDLCLTLLDNCDTLIASLNSSSNLFFSLQGHKTNQIMKTLTIVATIFIPLTFVVGVYGMNFKYMPEIEMEYGYYGVWAAMLIIIAGMLYYFKKKKWM